MPKQSLKIIETETLKRIPMQLASEDIWDKKYRDKDRNDQPLDHSISDTYKRVARALAEVEKPEEEDLWYHEFLWALENGAVPAGRIMSNAGADSKPNTSTINCTVSGTIGDSMDDILSKVHEAGITLKAGCGIGYEFSTLRPRGAFVSGSGSTTSGPMGFMDIYDKTCFVVSSAGGRRGAQMATFDISHPDVEEFIKAKREDGRLRQFNCSVLITDDFMEAVQADADWQLVFPHSKKDVCDEELEYMVEGNDYIFKKWPHHDEDYVYNDRGEVACRVYKIVKAKKLWNLIMASTYDYAEPGFILIDRVNEQNNLWWEEDIRSTNPCGEQPLPPYGSCLLGSIDLTKCVVNPFQNARFDNEKFRRLVRVFTRMLDNVVELNNLPLPQQQEEIMRKRRHGMGFFGLGSALSMLGMKYGSDDAVSFTSSVSYMLAYEGWSTGVELAKEKGPAPIFDEQFIVTEDMVASRTDELNWAWIVGDRVTGKELFAHGSRYMKKLFECDPVLKDRIATYGCRFTHHTSIAPTGTIALSFGNNASNGIEPSFSHSYSRNVIRPGKKSKEKVEVKSLEFLAYQHFVDPDATPDDLPESCVTSDQITPLEHVKMQAAAQKWVDSSISKTVNVPTDIPFEDFQDIYLEAWKRGLKGCTTFRYNPEVFQGVLVKDDDLKRTKYEFALDNGDVVQFSGDEKVEYDGEVHTAANLFDALKEGYYGKF